MRLEYVIAAALALAFLPHHAHAQGGNRRRPPSDPEEAIEYNDDPPSFPILPNGLRVPDAKETGREQVGDGFIVGGDPVADIADKPYQVALYRWRLVNSDWQLGFICGGVLITENWVATAAHCVNGLESPELYIVSFGTLRIYDWSPPDEKYRYVSTLIKHEDYDSRSQDNDLTLLKLTTSIPDDNDNIKPIVIAGGSDQFVDENVTVSGWGLLSEGGSVSSTLEEVTITALSNTQCNELYGARSLAVTDNMLCAGNLEGGEDSCQGDSGGPLTIKGKPTSFGTTEDVLVGVVSWGVGCARPDLPGVYVRIQRYIPWMVEKLEAN